MTRPRLRSPAQPFWLRCGLGLYEFAASLELAVVLIGGSALVLAFATLVESAFGDASKSGAANWAIYQTRWFAVLNGLLAVNVLCAALIRFPWRKAQTGFLMTHAGLLLILGGALATRLYGVDANVSILEGMSEWRAVEDAQHFKLSIQAPGKAQPEVVNVPFVPGPFNWGDNPAPWWLPLTSLGRTDRGLLYQRDGVKLETLDYYSDSTEIAVPRLVLSAGPPGSSRLALGDPDRGPQPIELEVRRGTASPMGARPFGTGDRKPLPGGQRVVFWMTGDPRETEAFTKLLPEGKLSVQGQVVLYAGGQRFVFAADQLKAGERRKLGATGLEMELVRLEAQFGGVVLSIHGPGEPQRMILLAEMPEHNHQDYRHGVFGAYWRETAPPAAEKGKPAESGMHAQMARPRIDILQGADQKLYARAWRSPRVDPVVPLPADGQRVVFWRDAPEAVQLAVAQFLPSAAPETRPAAVRFLAQKPLSAKQARVRVRLTVDGRAEEFWLARLVGDPGDALSGAEQRAVEHNGRRVSVALVPDEVDLGFRVRLERFNRKLDPGTGQASHYSSTVDILDRHTDKVLRRDVLITLNEPVNFSDPVTGRSFRLYQASFSGPFKPGDAAFESVAGTTPREQVFASVLSANYDPGRGMKYAGSLLIVGGVFLVFYLKSYFFVKRPAERAAPASRI
jgi:hypothetical protein